MMRTLKYTFLVFFTFFIFSLQAAFIRDIPRQMKQPDGEILHCFMSGDEYYQWFHDSLGYTIVQDPTTGFYVYADKVEGLLVPTEYIAGKTNPENIGIQPFLSISSEEWIEKREAMQPPRAMQPKIETKKLTSMHSLVVFIRFADDEEYTTPFSTVEAMFNATEEGANSMHNYYQNVSYGQFDITSTFYPIPNTSDGNDQIISFQDTNPRSYYQPYNAVTNPNGYQRDRGTRERTLLMNALNHIKDMVPTSIELDQNEDGNVDNTMFVVTGNVGEWLELLWPHKSSFWNDTVEINGKRVYDYTFHLFGAPEYFNVGVLSHETFHVLGAPDLYHYQEPYKDLTPVGKWDLMEKTANPPQQLTAYMKMRYGNWIDSIPELKKEGCYTIYPLNSKTADKTCYKIATDDPEEFFVMEYRRNNTFGENVPGSGMIFYRVNTRFYGNVDYNGTTILDEVYVFRVGGTPTENGRENNAFFHKNSTRNIFGPINNPYPFRSDGTPVDFVIYDFSATGGDHMTFRYASCVDSMWKGNCEGDSVSVTQIELPAISVYPNPFNDEIQIDVPGYGEGILYADIFDIYGRRLKTEILSENSVINCSEMPAGVYILRIRENQRILKTERIIKT